MPGLFRFSRARAALSTTADYLTIVAVADHPLWIMLAELKGAENSVADNEVILQKSTGGTTGGGAITPNGDGTPSFSVFTTWSAQPTLAAPAAGDERWRFGVQALGGVDKFQALPGTHILVPAGEKVSLRSLSGTSNIRASFIVLEH